MHICYVLCPGISILPSLPLHVGLYHLSRTPRSQQSTGQLSLLSSTLQLLLVVVSAGQVIFGHFCDIAPYPYVIIISGAGTSLSAYLLWGFAHNLGVVFAFVIVFGLMSGGFTSIWPAASADIVGPEHQATVPNVFGVLGAWKGVAAVIGPVVAAALHHPDQSSIRAAYSGYGFRDVTLFVGSMMLATAVGGVSSKFLSRR
ncbi:unnamed protein product [Rhizoctonia solani]|uniref:Major facilitator superfamily (MFS) profile domain-containing protein n=1 Tax=Rhizoctonia solani TaxID=456999 RepID=A0A8H2WM65_9AGAM|nr:unnamed protein product [Rhizoctonia solani]